MAVVTRYFSTTSSGAGDGTTWADRAALFSSGNWSSVMTGFSFAGSDSLHCRIGPGTYSCGQMLSSALFASIPGIVNNLSVLPCNSSGSLIRTWNPSWVSSQPVWDESTMPIIQSTTNIVTIGGLALTVEGIKFRATSRSGAIHDNIGGNMQSFYNCVFENAANSSNAMACNVSSSNQFYNCVFKCTGTAYDAVLRIINTALILVNCRIEGNPSASSGNRDGFNNNSGNATHIFDRCTFINNPGSGVDFVPGSSSSGLSGFFQCLIANNGGDGVTGNTSASKSTSQGFRKFDKTIIVNNGGWAVNQQTNFDIHNYSGCRMRNNASGKFSLGGTGNFYEIDPDDSAGTDADEFVDAASGDYRIKKTSLLWGKGLGPGDEPSSGSLILPSVSAWVA